MGWVNLNDMYLSKSGGTITGSLVVNGTLNNGGIVTSYGNTGADGAANSNTTAAQKKKIFTGSIVVTGADDTAKEVWSVSSFKSIFGKAFTPSQGDIVVFMNGDATSGSDAHIDGATYTSGGVYAVFDRTVSTSMNIRINYLVVLQN